MGRIPGSPSGAWLSEKDRQVARLIAIRSQLGYIPEHELKVSGDILHRAPHTVRAYVNKAFGRPPPREPTFAFDDWWIDLAFAYGANIAQMHREAEDAELGLPSLGTTYRAWNKVDPAIRKFATNGAKGYRNHLIYLRWEAETRNAIWQADACELDVWVLSANGKSSVKPHLIIFLDDKWRLVMGWAITFEKPTAADVQAAFAAAVLRKQVGDNWYGGRPDELLIDNGKEFTADDVTRLAMKVGTDAHAVKRYFAEKKGKVERYFGAFQHSNLRTLPAYTGSPLSWTKRDIFRSWAHRRKEEDPDRKRVYHGPLSDLLTQTGFILYIAGRIRLHNFVQRPRDLGGLTRWEGWCSDQTPLVEVPLATVRDHLRALPDHTVSKQGIELYGQYYVPTKAEGHGYADVGQEVSVRTLPNSEPWLEVFDTSGRWLDTFKPSKEFSADEIADREADRLATYHKAKQHAKRAGTLRVARIGEIDAMGGMPSLADVAVSASTKPALPVQAPRIVKSAPAAGQLFALPVDVEAAVVAARKKTGQSSGRSRAARAKAPSLVLVSLDDTA